MDQGAMFKIGYGLYVLTAREGKKDNGCIINSMLQVTSNPNRIAITVNKQNLTHDLIVRTDAFNVSILTEKTAFQTFQHFGFQSGKNCDKFEDSALGVRSPNGIFYVPEFANAYISGSVIYTKDLGTHSMFIADVVDAKVLSNEASLTYAYYQENIKPRPAVEPKKGYRCRICGYVYEGETLPADFVCPICKHSAEDFEPIG